MWKLFTFRDILSVLLVLVILQIYINTNVDAAPGPPPAPGGAAPPPPPGKRGPPGPRRPPSSRGGSPPPKKGPAARSPSRRKSAAAKPPVKQAVASPPSKALPPPPPLGVTYPPVAPTAAFGRSRGMVTPSYYYDYGPTFPNFANMPMSRFFYECKCKPGAEVCPANKEYDGLCPDGIRCCEFNI